MDPVATMIPIELDWVYNGPNVLWLRWRCSAHVLGSHL